MQPGNTRRMRNLVDTKTAVLDKAILDYVALCRRAFVKTRIRLTYRMICNKARRGDAGDVDAAAAAGAMEDLRKSLEPWDVDCIFHMDEAGLFFSQLPSYSLLTREDRGVQGRGG
eukprot:jgi/Mesvir1/8700/Mv02636-RA.1